MKRVGIIGAGLIGAKRAANLKGAQLISVCDLDQGRAQKLAASYGAQTDRFPEELAKRKDIDVVIVSTTNEALTACALAALESGKDVLLEKPGGRNPEEIQSLLDAVSRTKRVLRVGFNHRFHPGFQKARELITKGDFGPLMYMRGRYGHGGRIGYDKEWRADPERSGGGELLDQGVHLIDLCRWLGGEFKLEWGLAKTFFWDMPVEDNGFLMLRSPDGTRSAWLHASCSEWKNLFDFEIFCKTGKLEIWGLGRSYGTEELRVYKMKPEMGPPDITVDSFAGDDVSWQLEFDAFLKELDGVHTDIATAADALRALEIVREVYQLSSASQSPCNA